jgi:hypothetical protein
VTELMRDAVSFMGTRVDLPPKTISSHSILSRN